MAIDKGTAEAVIRFVGEDKVTDLVQHINGKIDGMAGKTQKATDATASLKAGWASVATGLNSSLDLIGKFGSLVSGTLDKIKESAQSVAIEENFKRQFAGAEAAMERLRASVGGQIDDTNLQKLANQAKQAGLSIGQMEDALGLAARAAGAGFGEPIENAQKVITGLVKGDMKRLLSQWGVQADMTTAVADETKRLGRELSDAEKTQLALTQSLEAGGRAFGGLSVSEGTLASINKLQASWANFMDTAQRSLLAIADTGFWADINQNLLDLHPFTWVQNAAEGMWDAVAGNDVKLNKAMFTAFDEAAATIETYKKRQEEAAAATRRQAEAADAARKATEAHNHELWDHFAAADKAALAERARKAELLMVATAMGDLANVQKLTKEMTGAGTVNLLQQVTALRDHKRAAIEAAAALATVAFSQAVIKNDSDMMAVAQQQFAEMRRLAGDADKAQAKGKGGGGGGGRSSSAKKDRQLGGALAGAEGMLDSASDTEMFGLARPGSGVEQGESPLALWLREQGEEMQAAAAEIKERVAKDLAEAVQVWEKTIKDSAASSFDTATQALQASGDEFVSVFGLINEQVGGQVSSFMDLWAKADAAGKGVGSAVIAAAPGMIAASGKIAGALAKDKRWEFGFLAAGEVAASIGAFARQDYFGGALHAAAAVQYGVAAGLAGGGGGGGKGGGGRGKPNLPDGAGSSQQTAPAPPPITIHVGTLWSDDKTTVRRLATEIAREGRFAGSRGFAP